MYKRTDRGQMWPTGQLAHPWLKSSSMFLYIQTWPQGLEDPGTLADGTWVWLVDAKGPSGGRNNAPLPPKDARILIPGTCEYVTFCGKRHFAVAIKLRSWRWGDAFGVCWWPDMITRVPRRGWQEGQRERLENATAGVEERGQAHRPRTAGGLWKPGH